MTDFEFSLTLINICKSPSPSTVSVPPSDTCIFVPPAAPPSVLPFRLSVTLPVTVISRVNSLFSIFLYSVTVAVPASLALSKASIISPNNSVFSPPSV